MGILPASSRGQVSSESLTLNPASIQEGLAPAPQGQNGAGHVGCGLGRDWDALKWGVGSSKFKVGFFFSLSGGGGGDTVPVVWKCVWLCMYGDVCERNASPVV